MLYGDDLAYIHAAGFSGLAEGAAPEIIRRFRSAPGEVRRVLDVGCGAGPVTAALNAAGFEVIGLDASADLVAMARQSVPSATFLHGTVYGTPLPACDAIVAVGEPLAYHSETAPADALLRGFFQSAAETLPRGGLLIFDVIETGEPSLSGRSWRSGKDWAVLVETEERPQHLFRKIETFRRIGELYRRGREVHSVRLFDTRALLDDLERCGFTVETAQFYGSHALPPRRRAFFATRRPV